MSAIEIQPGERDIWRIVQALISLIRKWNASGQVTLRAGQVTTVVDKSVAPGATNVAIGDEVILSPRTANAATSLTSVYISSVTQGSFVLSHNSSAQTDRIYGFGVR